MQAERSAGPRVFGIGLNKTGTSSLHEALQALGLRSLHWGGPEVRELVEGALDAGRPLVDDLDHGIDAFSDIEALSLNFDLLDVQYPGSRFILTVRPVEDWIESRRRHVELNRRRKLAGEYSGSFLDIDGAGWRRAWSAHIDRARAYFGDRPDFLEVDITQGLGWKPLCELLGVPEPDMPFPWSNRGNTCG